MNPFDHKPPICGVRKTILIGSGKGGVGKSTVAAHLALALKNQGLKVGLLDADIYGPSVPRIFGCLHQRVELTAEQKMLPIERYGIKLMSMGFLIPEDSAVVWRGPMLFKALDQFFRDVIWEPLDILLIDLPPGTGDVALTMAQKIPVDGAILVSTPQNLAWVDARRALDMFQRLALPVLGVVENMSGLFPKGQMASALSELKIKKLAEVPFENSLALACEAGIPQASRVFEELARKLRCDLHPGGLEERGLALDSALSHHAAHKEEHQDEAPQNS